MAVVVFTFPVYLGKFSMIRFNNTVVISNSFVYCGIISLFTFNKERSSNALAAKKRVSLSNVFLQILFYIGSHLYV